jgi:hypothetical protein
VTSGDADFKSGGETEERTKTSQETTVSGDISGKVGGEKGPGAEAKVGVEHKSGTEREMSVKGAGDVTMKMGANVYRAEAWVQVALNIDARFFSKEQLGPKLEKVGVITYGAPAAPGAPTGEK